MYNIYVMYMSVYLLYVCIYVVYCDFCFSAWILIATKNYPCSNCSGHEWQSGEQDKAPTPKKSSQSLKDQPGKSLAFPDITSMLGSGNVEAYLIQSREENKAYLIQCEEEKDARGKNMTMT